MGKSRHHDISRTKQVELVQTLDVETPRSRQGGPGGHADEASPE